MEKTALFATDYHGSRLLFEKLFRAATDTGACAVIYGGDICPRGFGPLSMSGKIQKEFLSWIVGRIAGIRKGSSGLEFYIIMGNDDLRVNERILVEADADGILHYMNKKAAGIWKYSIVGYSYVPVTPFRLKDWEKYEDSGHGIAAGALDLPQGFKSIEAGEEADNIEDDLRRLKALSDPSKTIYVTHSPPNGTRLDMIHSGAHVGSLAIRRFIEKERPLLTLHGHIHESPKKSGGISDSINGTLCINPGSDFAILNDPSVAKIVKIDLADPSGSELLEL